MSAYHNGGSTYNLHAPVSANANSDAVNQQQHQHQPPFQGHHGLASPVQPYPYDPTQQDSAQAYNDTRAQTPQTPDNGVDKPKWKGNRLRKACDSCSIRKVRCDESGPPCLACAALEIPCTFERPSRRRGPPNRHAEAIKRRRQESPSASGSLQSPTWPASASPDNAAATLASLSSHAVLSAESICPLPILELLVDDYFTYIHPLVPFPHEPTFRHAFQQREDLSNPSFLALLAAMIGALVASFPRRPRLHLKHQNREHLFPNSVSLVERCHKVAVDARGPGYLDKDLNVYDAATSYLLALAGAYTFQYTQFRLYFGETMTILRVVGAHRVKDIPVWSYGRDGTSPGEFGQADQPVDYLRQELARRIWWCSLTGVRSMQQLGATFAELVVPPPTPSNPYPPLPMEVDDEYIFADHVEPQPEGVISQLTGFNLNVRVFMCVTPIATMELAYGIDEAFDINRQKRVLEECLRAVKRIPDGAPRELVLIPGSAPGVFEGQNEREHLPPILDYSGSPPLHRKTGFPDDARRYLQYEIQKANIYASQLGTRSYVVEKYWNIVDAYEARLKAREAAASPPSAQTSPGAWGGGIEHLLRSPATSVGNDVVEGHMTLERENIVKDLLRVLGSISQVNMEPNGGSFINKIRQIASTLLDTPRNRKGPLALRAEEYLARFLDVLMKLERSIPPSMSISRGLGVGGGGDDAYASQAQTDEEELRNWADLREFQNRFATKGGFLNEFV